MFDIWNKTEEIAEKEYCKENYKIVECAGGGGTV